VGRSPLEWILANGKTPSAISISLNLLRYVEGLNDARTKLGAFFNTQLLKDSPLDDMTEIGHITNAIPA
jgi:hypothetical protein